MRNFTLFLLANIFTSFLFAQCDFELNWEYKYNDLTSPLTLEADKLNRPYLYVASNESGLKIFKTDGTPVTEIPSEDLGLNPMSFTQVGSLLYVAIGNHFGDSAPGLAIVNIENPEDPIILDSWVHNEVSKGAGIVKIEGDYAFLGAMKLGLIILNISNPNQIEFVSQTPLDINFPHPNPGNENLYNARGMEVRNDTAYIAFDAGGIRILDCTDKQNPVQIGQFANPVTFEPINLPRAYNNIVLNGSIAYVAVDYCGVEILDISDPANIELLNHYNPVNCPVGVWHDAPIHANEMIFNEACQKLFVSSGKSELIALDVSDPNNVESCGMFGTTEDTTATWGIGMRNDSIFLSYLIIPVYIPIIHPFDAKWNGIKMVKWENPCDFTQVNESPELKSKIETFPNPTSGEFTLEIDNYSGKMEIEIMDVSGKILEHKQISNPVSESFFIDEKSGIYFVKIRLGNQIEVFKIIKI